MRGVNLPSAVMSTPLLTGCSVVLSNCAISVPSNAPETPLLPSKLLIVFTMPDCEVLVCTGLVSPDVVTGVDVVVTGVDVVSNDCGI